jgi:hypothetical protein
MFPRSPRGICYAAMCPRRPLPKTNNVANRYHFVPPTTPSAGTDEASPLNTVMRPTMRMSESGPSRQFAATQHFVAFGAKRTLTKPRWGNPRRPDYATAGGATGGEPAPSGQEVKPPGCHGRTKPARPPGGCTQPNAGAARPGPAAVTNRTPADGRALAEITARGPVLFPDTDTAGWSAPRRVW